MGKSFTLMAQDQDTALTARGSKLEEVLWGASCQPGFVVALKGAACF